MQTNLKIIAVSGAEAEKFLQGQLTCDVQAIADGHSSLGAHCNAKGRIMSLFRIYRQGDAFHLEMPSEVIDVAFAQLKKYAVFSKNVTLEILPSPNNEPNWHRHNIEAGIPRLYPQTIGEFLPHYINLVELGGVSFTKGCYTGQEIIARMQHRGKLKQHMQLFEFPITIKIIPGKDLLTSNEHSITGQAVDVMITDDIQHALIIITTSQ
jgi:folate-binding protein YgfZ